MVAYEVIHTRVVVRAAPSTKAAAVATKTKGQIVASEATSDDGKWIRISSNPEGWMLIDGTSLGFGQLLRPLPPSPLQQQQQPASGGDEAVLLRSGVTMPLLGVGTGGVPGLEGEMCEELVAHALRLGVRLVDTSPDYGNEEQVGMALRRSGVPRASVFLTTKVGPLRHGYDEVNASVRASLRRLGVEYLDLVVLHWPGAWVAEQREWTAADWLGGRAQALARERRAASWRALEDLHAAGTLRAIGVSNYTPPHLLELLHTCRRPPDVLQSEHHPFFANAMVRGLCASHGIAFQAYGPLSGGAVERANSQRGVDNAVVQRVATAVGRTPAQVLLRWSTQRGVAVLPKSRRRAGVEENAAARGFELSDEALRALDALETGKPSYWDPECVESLDGYNVFLDKERLQRECG